MTTANIIVFGVWIASVACTIDAVRRPSHAWAEADRNSRWWRCLLVTSSLMVLPGVVAVPAYVFGVAPRFGSEVPGGDEFAKRS